jgi:hypothetical protein
VEAGFCAGLDHPWRNSLLFGKTNSSVTADGERRICVNRQQVVDAISALASGVHPATGEVFGEDSPYNHPQVIRALFASLELIQAPAGRAPKRSQEEINREEGRPLRFNMRWTEQEDEELLDLIEKGIATPEIAERFERTQGSIHSRLQRHGLLEREELLNRSDEEILQLARERMKARAQQAEPVEGQL